MMPCSAALALIVVSGVTAQFDGNPHGWDRKRRCDHTAYEPPCGACEGYGGIPTGAVSFVGSYGQSNSASLNSLMQSAVKA